MNVAFLFGPFETGQKAGVPLEAAVSRNSLQGKELGCSLARLLL